MIYIDSSSFVKILRPEPESSAVFRAVDQESAVIVSALAELEMLTKLKADFLAGEYTRSLWHRLEAQLAALHNQPPYEFRTLPAGIFRTALRQHRNSRDVHCRALDRLHLAAMEELEINRLLTHDDRQAKAAREAGFTVIQPGRD